MNDLIVVEKPNVAYWKWYCYTYIQRKMLKIINFISQDNYNYYLTVSDRGVGKSALMKKILQ